MKFLILVGIIQRANQYEVWEQLIDGIKTIMSFREKERDDAKCRSQKIVVDYLCMIRPQ